MIDIILVGTFWLLVFAAFCIVQGIFWALVQAVWQVLIFLHENVRIPAFWVRALLEAVAFGGLLFLIVMMVAKIFLAF